MDALLHRLLCAAVLLLTLVASAARAEDTWPNGTAESTSVEAEYDKRIRAASAMDGLGTDLFGDSVNLYSGALSFTATDVSVPGNFDLPVAIGRRFTVGSGTSSFSHFGDWELDIPHLSGVFAQLSDNSWINTASGSARFNRCSRFEAPPTAAGSTGNGGFFEPYEFWHGVYLSTPSGRDEVLLRDAALSWQPTDGNAYPLVTTGRWMIRCLPTTASGEPGEAFLAVSLSCYFHEDWPVESENDAGIVLLFLKSGVNRDQANRLADQLTIVAKNHLNEPSNEWLLRQYGCYYDPEADGLNASEWMIRLADLVRKAEA